MGSATDFALYLNKKATRHPKPAAKAVGLGWLLLGVASMDATEKQRSDFGKIRTKIIEPAVKEHMQKDSWLIQWEPIKASRKVKSLRITFMRNPQGSLPL